MKLLTIYLVILILSWTISPFIKKLASKKLYLSASLEYMQAMTRLSEAEIRIKRIDEYNQWKIIKDFNLEKKIKKRIKACEKQIFLLQWKRT